MKRVINGKLYNTETAKEVFTWSNHYYRNDFHFCEETLYRTPKGAFFVAGEGGPMSKYAVPVGSNGRGGGDGLEVLSDAEALAWLEEKEADVETIERFFPGRIEEA
ncbi:MAG: hypothetical protein WC082_11245 [Victivallales bacterium]|nr:hypothetical protein [Candidatus Izemoplasmatales bacterium]